MKKTLFILLLCSLSFNAHAQGYSNHPQARDMMRSLNQQGFEMSELKALFSGMQRKQSIIDAMNRPAEGVMTWARYQDIFLKPDRITQGVQFWQTHEETLLRASLEHGVPPEIIVAIIGIESKYGKFKGKHRILDALATLSFDYPRRSKFFSGELKHFIKLGRNEGLDITSLKGSYAGAMGWPQFIPSSYQSYAVDFDGDGSRDLFHSVDDVIGSVANYFARHGWKTGHAIASETLLSAAPNFAGASKKPQKAKIATSTFKTRGIEALGEAEPKAALLKLKGKHGDEYWLTYQNFYVITRYNHSTLYAMAALQLSQKIKQQFDQAMKP